MGRSKLHIAAVVLAAINLLYSVTVSVVALWGIIGDYSQSEEALAPFEILVLLLFTFPISSTLLCAVLLIMLLMMRISNAVKKLSVYWFGMTLSVMMSAGGIVGLGGMAPFVFMLLTCAACGVLVLASDRFDNILAVVMIAGFSLITFICEVIVISSMNMWDMAFVFPWYPIVPMLPAAVTCLMIIDKHRAKFLEKGQANEINTV